MIDYYDWLMRSAEKNEANPEIGKPTIDDIRKIAQVEELHRIANAVEKLVKQGEPIKVSL
jgi:hypothetical protein